MKRISSYVMAAACLLIAAASVQTQTPARVTVFEGARLITGDGSAAIENSVFIMENNLFTAVGRQGQLQIPAGATRVNLAGKTVMPAKVDLHGHLGYEDVVAGTTSKANFNRANLIEHLERFAYMGWSAVISIADLEEREIFPGDHLDVYQSKRDPLLPKTGRMPWGHLPSQMAKEVIPNAALFRTAGQGMGTPGGGAGGHPSRNDVMYPITTPDEARRAVQDYVKTNPEFVKIWVDSRNGQLKMGTLTPPLYIAVIQEARRLGFDTAAHTVTLADAKELYKAGMVGAVHIPVRGGDHPDEEFLQIIRDRVAKSDRPLWFQEHGSSNALGPQSWDDPLLWEMLERDQVMDQQGAAIKRMTPESVARGKASSKAIGDDSKKLIAAGMKLVYGSDNGAAGRGFGWYEQLRFENWVSMGFTPNEAITMATRDGAVVAKLNTGLVAKGKSADFIVLDANPLENIANTRRINKVYLRGAEVDRAGIRAKWQKKWGKWATNKPPAGTPAGREVN